MPTPSTDLCDLTARELVALLHDRRVSAREVMTAHLARIDQVNTAVNAIVTLVPDAALDAAEPKIAAALKAQDFNAAMAAMAAKSKTVFNWKNYPLEL